MYSEEDNYKITNAIIEAEKKTTGEIVPMILPASDLYPTAHFRLAIIGGIFSAIALYYTPIALDSVWYLWAQVPGMIAGYLLAFLPLFKRPFITKREITEEVRQRALAAFLENNLHMTSNRAGVLIFVSLLEHRIEIIADGGINKQVSADTWKEIADDLRDSIVKKQIIDGLCAAIEKSGKLLEKAFPDKKNYIDELPNQLITD